jgi:hypothetical protein
MRRTVLPAAAALLALLSCGEASATAVDAAFEFQAHGVTFDGKSITIGSPILDGPITRNNIDVKLYETMLDLTPVPIGVDDNFTLSFDTTSGNFTDSFTEISVTGDDPRRSLTIIAKGLIFAPGSSNDYGPTPSSILLDFEDGGVTGSFDARPPVTSGPPAVPEPSSWAMLLFGFAGLGAAGLWRTRKPAGFGA